VLNDGVPILERVRIHGDPLSVHGRTVIPIAALQRLELPLGPARFVHTRARPAAVEVIEPDGSHRIVPIHDPSWWAFVATRVLPVALAAVSVGLRVRRSRRRAA
jgi:hypothetical protein